MLSEAEQEGKRDKCRNIKMTRRRLFRPQVSRQKIGYKGKLKTGLAELWASFDRGLQVQGLGMGDCDLSTAALSPDRGERPLTSRPAIATSDVPT